MKKIYTLILLLLSIKTFSQEMGQCYSFTMLEIFYSIQFRPDSTFYMSWETMTEKGFSQGRWQVKHNVITLDSDNKPPEITMTVKERKLKVNTGLIFFDISCFSGKRKPFITIKINDTIVGFTDYDGIETIKNKFQSRKTIEISEVAFMPMVYEVKNPRSNYFKIEILCDPPFIYFDKTKAIFDVAGLNFVDHRVLWMRFKRCLQETP